MPANGDGTTSGWFRLPDLHAGILKTAIEALIAPRKTATPEPDPVTGRTPDHATRMGQGLCEILEHLPIDGYGDHGGVAATLILTLDHEVLKTGLGAAALVDGTEVSPGEARRLACGAGIIPPSSAALRRPRPRPRTTPLHESPTRRPRAARPGLPRRGL